MTTDIHDLAKRAHVLRARIFGDERKLATAYPDQVEKLEGDLERERAQLADLEEHIEAAREELRTEVADSVDRYFAARDLLLKLHGQFRDPGFQDMIFTRSYASRPTGSPFGGIDLSVLDGEDAVRVKRALLRVTEIEPLAVLEVSDSQRLHEERVRNERAGRGHYTDEELQRLAENPDEFRYGQGFRRMKPMRAPGRR